MVLYCCTDLIFSTKIRSTAESLDVPAKAIKLDAELTPFADADGEGDDSAQATAVMVDLELGEGALSLIERTRTEVPDAQVIAFGSHVAKDVLDAAKEKGAHQVLPRSAFTEKLPELLQQHKG
jgi:DNA-binding NarL/FixJ family response regulator